MSLRAPTGSANTTASNSSTICLLAETIPDPRHSPRSPNGDWRLRRMETSSRNSSESCFDSGSRGCFVVLLVDILYDVRGMHKLGRP